MAWIILDGYNLIRRSIKGASVKDADLGRSALVAQLSAYKKIKNHRITLVFDATASDNRKVEELSWAGIHVVYTSFGQTADAWIIETLRREKEKVIVVSSDNEILRAANQAGAGYLSSQEFEDQLDKALRYSPHGNEENFFEDEKPVHKRWMTKKKGPAKRLPKGKRKALNKI